MDDTMARIPTPMTPEERRRLLMAPLTFNVYGGRNHATGGGGKRTEEVRGNYIDDNRDADAGERK